MPPTRLLSGCCRATENISPSVDETVGEVVVAAAADDGAGAGATAGAAVECASMFGVCATGGEKMDGEYGETDGAAPPAAAAAAAAAVGETMVNEGEGDLDVVAVGVAVLLLLLPWELLLM